MIFPEKIPFREVHSFVYLFFAFVVGRQYKEPIITKIFTNGLWSKIISSVAHWISKTLKNSLLSFIRQMGGLHHSLLIMAPFYICTCAALCLGFEDFWMKYLLIVKSHKHRCNMVQHLWPDHEFPVRIRRVQPRPYCAIALVEFSNLLGTSHTNTNKICYCIMKKKGRI